MRDEEQLNPGHTAIRQTARVVGPLLMLAGVLFIAVALISFFSAFGTFEQPKYFWCFFVGAPLFALGSVITKVAFLGAIIRYVAGETAPVQKDTFNYMAHGVKSGVRDLSQAVSEGIRAGMQEPPAGDGRFCPQCGKPVAVDAQFCSSCGCKLQ